MAETTPEPTERAGGPETAGPPRGDERSWRRELDLPEVDEADAQGEVAEVYEAIRAALRAGVVSFVWRVFATRPKFLSAVWSELEPAVDGGVLEMADGIRALAIQRVREATSVPDHRPAIGDDLERAVEQLRVFLEVNPRLLILLCALERSWRGQEVGGHRRPVPAALEPGVPRWHPRIEVRGADAVPEVFREMTDLLDLPAPDADYRMLAAWPDYLRAAWGDLRAFVPTQSWVDVCRTVEAVADQAAVALPAPVRVSPARAGELGLGPDEVGEVGRWIEALHGLLPGLVVNTSYLWIGLKGGTDRLPPS